MGCPIQSGRGVRRIRRVCGHGSWVGVKYGQSFFGSCIKWCILCRSGLGCVPKSIGVAMPQRFSQQSRYAIGFALGLIVFIAVPESVRWMNGGAVAQQTLSNIYNLPNNTAIGTVILGDKTVSATGSPDQTAPVIGGESNVTACPGQGSSPQSVVGTYVGPGSHLNVTASSGGGKGPVTGFRSSVTVGGPGCQ
jgi:hypothetical protein